MGGGAIAPVMPVMPALLTPFCTFKCASLIVFLAQVRFSTAGHLITCHARKGMLAL